jgi:phosphoketolase
VIYKKMADITEKSYERIKSIQNNARKNNIFNKEKYPVIILKTPK